MKPREMKKKKKQNRENQKENQKKKKNLEVQKQNITCAAVQRAEQANRSRAGSAAAAVQRALLPLCRARRCAEGALVQRERLTEASRGELEACRVSETEIFV